MNRVCIPDLIQEDLDCSAFDIDDFENTLRNTTQDNVTKANRPLHRRYRAQNSRYMYTFLYEVWYTDTVHGRVSSYNNCLYAQIYTNRSMVLISIANRQPICRHCLIFKMELCCSIIYIFI